MKTISIISQKGGAGKTTLALNLAGAAEELGFRTVIVDLDPQASAKGWHDHRQREAPVVISAQAARLSEVLATASDHGADICIIDTAPHSETAALAAARAADLIIIPCRPAILDIRAISSSVDLAQLSKKSAVVILNSAQARGSLADDAEKAIASYGLPIAPFRITHRAAFIHSLTAGQTVIEYEPSGAAAEEVRALALHLCQLAGMVVSRHASKMVGKGKRKANLA